METFILYLITRLDPLCAALGIVLFVLAIATVWVALDVSMDASLGYNTAEGTGRLKKLGAWLAVVAVVMVIIPSKKDVVLILAGTAVIEAARTDTAQRIAGKSVRVIEGLLDKALETEGDK